MAVLWRAPKKDSKNEPKCTPKNMWIWTSEIDVFGTPAESSWDRAWRPGVSKWRPGGPALAPGQRQLDYSSTFSRAGSDNGGGGLEPRRSPPRPWFLNGPSWCDTRFCSICCRNLSESVSDALSDPIHLVSALVSDWVSDLLFNSMDWCLTWSPM